MGRVASSGKGMKRFHAIGLMLLAVAAMLSLSACAERRSPQEGPSYNYIEAGWHHGGGGAR